MKKRIKTWSIRIGITTGISLISIIGAVLNPGLLYANKTEIGNYTVYHSGELDEAFHSRMTAVQKVMSESELYDEELKIDICLNDGSLYPRILKIVLPPAFGWSISNKAVFQGVANYKENVVEVNSYQWNLEQLFVHEMTHCYQFNHFGFLQSKPVANQPTWKWEGYAEYASRKESTQLSILENIKRKEQARTDDPDEWGIFFDDETVAPREYFDYWLLVQYCLDIKGMTYIELINSSTPKEALELEMKVWYASQMIDESSHLDINKN
jgi:hypothetical protein